MCGTTAERRQRRPSRRARSAGDSLPLRESLAVVAMIAVVDGRAAGAQPAPPSPRPDEAAPADEPAATAAASPAAQEAAVQHGRSCVPACRSGFVCVNGECVSSCKAYLCVTFLSHAPSKTEIAPLHAHDWKPELFKVVGKEMYTWYPNGQGRSPLAAALGKLPLRAATTRNWNTVQKLVEMLDDG